jgi:hypothetical protein
LNVSLGSAFFDFFKFVKAISLGRNAVEKPIGAKQYLSVADCRRGVEIGLVAIESIVSGKQAIDQLSRQIDRL